MTEWQVARHRVGIAGRVIDGETQSPISGADIRVLAMPGEFQTFVQRAALQHESRWHRMVERLDRTRSRSDGLFYFMTPSLSSLGLPLGDYTLEASLPVLGRRYGAVRKTLRVIRDADGNAGRVSLTLPLPPTSVRGRVTGPGREGGIAMAEVRVKGSGERTFSSIQGEYVLAGVEPGERTIVVVAQGFQPAYQQVVLAEAGVAEVLPFVLTKENGAASFTQSTSPKGRGAGARARAN